MKKSVSVLYTASARKDLLKLDRDAARMVVTGIERKTRGPDPLAGAKPLSGLFDGLHRYRIGDYRAIFEMDETRALVILTILRIRHRKDAYR